MQIILKDNPDIDPNDQNSILEHLDKVVFIGSSYWQLICTFFYFCLSFYLFYFFLFMVAMCYLFMKTLLYFAFIQVRNLIEKSSKKAVNRSELKLPLVRIKVFSVYIFK